MHVNDTAFQHGRCEARERFESSQSLTKSTDCSGIPAVPLGGSPGLTKGH